MIHRCNICARPTLPSLEFGVRICVAHGPLTWDAFRAHLERDIEAQADMHRSALHAKAQAITFAAGCGLDRLRRRSGDSLVELYNRLTGGALLYVPTLRGWVFEVGADGRPQYRRARHA